MNDDILKKLIKVANNQQKILKTLAQQTSNVLPLLHALTQFTHSIVTKSQEADANFNKLATDPLNKQLIDVCIKDYAMIGQTIDQLVSSLKKLEAYAYKNPSDGSKSTGFGIGDWINQYTNK